MTDYASIYSSYWADPARWGSSSLRDVEQTAESVLNTCGPGRILDVGSGMGGLVRALLRHGVDAMGLDVAQRCVDEGNRQTPGRFVQGSLLTLPFEDGAFATVVSTDVLEHLAEEDVPAALAEMARVARRSLFLRVATTPDRDGRWHLTVRDRAWWERQCFAAGLRRHPLLLAAVPYESLEGEGWQATLVLEKVPTPALARHPLQSLKGERDLHMDMLRESGRRSDAHLARYHLACQFVRPGDTVLDVACGLGYGSAILCAGTQAGRVIAIDESASAVAYARDCFAATGSAVARPIEFEVGDAHDLSRLDDASVDVVVSFETLEHLREPGRFLDEVRRVLTPGGRVVLSVPNQWTDESGSDPNPHHLQVYTWDRLREEVGGRFILERRFAQVAGGGMKHREGVRTLREAPLPPGSACGVVAPPAPLAPALPTPEPPAEWWLAVGMKEPVGAAAAGFRDTVYPDHTGQPGFNVAAFARDYENPWLVRAMVALGLRCTGRRELGEMAQRVVRNAPADAATPDLGAALCVLGYRLLDGPLDAACADELLSRMASYERAVDAAAARSHARRWVISNAYLAGQVLLAVGRRGEAQAAFRRCAAMDVLAFSPLLASKTIDASYHAGLIAIGDGDLDGAVADFKAGLAELRRALDAGDWANIIGSIDRPLTFGLIDLQQCVELAARCAFGVACAPLLRERPALAWTLLRRRALGDLKKWSEQQTASIEWLREQRRELERALGEARSWISRQDQGRSWLEEQKSTLEERLRALAEDSAGDRERQRAIIAEQKTSLEWGASQRRELEQRLRDRDETIQGLRRQLEARKSGEQWLAGQKRDLEARLGERNASISDLKERIATLVKAREWFLQRIGHLESHVAGPDGDARASRSDAGAGERSDDAAASSIPSRDPSIGT